MQITSGVLSTPLKVVIYGPEGIGKSTFAAQAPGALFIDTEGSTARMNVRRLPAPTSYAMIQEEVRYVIANPSVCQTLVLDTADWAERLCRDSVCAKNSKAGLEDFGYGKGYSYVFEDFGRLLNLLDQVTDRGINVLITAHAAMRKFEQPDESGAYDRWELKLQNSAKSNICAMLKEWADLILFCNYEVHTYKTEDNKVKASGGQRVMYTSHHPSWDAKNRHGLPEKLPMDFAAIAHIFLDKAITSAPQPFPMERVSVPIPIEPVKIQESQQNIELPFEIPDPEPAEDFSGIDQRLIDLMKGAGVSVAQVEQAVVRKGYMPEGMPLKDYPKDFVDGCLIGAWDAVLATIV